MKRPRLEALALLMALIACGEVALGSSADDPKPNASTELPPSAEAAADVRREGVAKSDGSPTRPEPPVPPRQYLETGARLFNKGRYELASRYLDAAMMYRDRLSSNERIVLDVYKGKLDQYFRELQSAAEPSRPVSDPGQSDDSEKALKDRALEVGSTDTKVNPASTVGTASAGHALNPFQGLGAKPYEADLMPVGSSVDSKGMIPSSSAEASAKAQGIEYGTESWRGPAEPKQKARWLLKIARENITKRQFDIAAKAIAEARAMNVRWTLFDETPDRLTETLAKARSTKPKESHIGDSATSSQHDRRTAKSWLKEARAALASNDIDRAEAIAREVKSWKLGFGLFEDTPDKVVAAVSEARRRDAVRNAELMVRSYLGDGSNRPSSDAPATPDAPTSAPVSDPPRER